MKKSRKKTKKQNSDLFDDRINEVLLGNTKKLNSKNKKLLKVFKEKADYIYLFYCLTISAQEFDNWSVDLECDSLDDKFNRLIYLLNKNLDECIQDLDTSMIDNIKPIEINKFEQKKLKKLVSYKELAEKVGL